MSPLSSVNFGIALPACEEPYIGIEEEAETEEDEDEDEEAELVVEGVALGSIWGVDVIPPP